MQEEYKYDVGDICWINYDRKPLEVKILDRYYHYDIEHTSGPWYRIVATHTTTGKVETRHEDGIFKDKPLENEINKEINP